MHQLNSMHEDNNEFPAELNWIFLRAFHPDGKLVQSNDVKAEKNMNKNFIVRFAHHPACEWTCFQLVGHNGGGYECPAIFQLFINLQKENIEDISIMDNTNIFNILFLINKNNPEEEIKKILNIIIASRNQNQTVESNIFSPLEGGEYLKTFFFLFPFTLGHFPF